MKISIYLASFVLIKAMMPGALYAPLTNGVENGSDDVNTATAAPAPADGSINNLSTDKLSEFKDQALLLKLVEKVATLEKQLEQQRNAFQSQLATQAEETKRQIEESRKLPPAPPPPPPPVQPAPQKTALKPTLHKKKKTPEEEKEEKTVAAVAESVNEMNRFIEKFKCGGSVRGTLKNHKQKGSSKPSVQAVFGSGNSATGNTQSGAGESQESGHDPIVSVKAQIENLQDEQSQQDSVKPEIAENPTDLTARSSVPVVKEQVEETASDAEEKPKTLKERSAMFEPSKTTVDKKAPVPEQTSTRNVSSLKTVFEQHASASQQNT